MMGNTKKEFKWFTIIQYKQEEEYLSSMHRKGWRFTKVVFPGIYSFVFRLRMGIFIGFCGIQLFS